MCPVDEHCSKWMMKHMGYCLCSTRDGISLGLGITSVVAWGVAEIPQIITNYKKKSAEGLSILFLLTWIVGDSFNVIGCMLVPATLQTQYYTAVLYLVNTVLLFAQSVYYGHIYPGLKSNRNRQEPIGAMGRKEQNDDLNAEEVNNAERWHPAQSPPIPLLSSSPLSNEQLLFLSARSLAVIQKPTPGSSPAARTPPSDIEQNLVKEPLLGDIGSPQSVPLTKIKTTLCVVSLMTIFLAICNTGLAESLKYNIHGKSTIGVADETLAAEGSEIGIQLGWGMAAIYLGGRLPQICLNIRRGNVEGLNPLMFIFAVVGNGAYVASILVSSLDWSKIQPNLPWVVESSGCVCLDCFILLQFFCFRNRSSGTAEKYVSPQIPLFSML